MPLLSASHKTLLLLVKCELPQSFIFSSFVIQPCCFQPSAYLNDLYLVTLKTPCVPNPKPPRSCTCSTFQTFARRRHSPDQVAQGGVPPLQVPPGRACPWKQVRGWSVPGQRWGSHPQPDQGRMSSGRNPGRAHPGRRRGSSRIQALLPGELGAI